MAWSVFNTNTVVNTNNVVSYPEEPMNADMAAEVKRYLDKLGTTTAEIRSSLVDLGMTGTQGDSASCPLARYLNESLRTRVRVTVDGAILEKNGPTVTMIAAGISVRLLAMDAPPEVVTIESLPLIEFIGNFDRARYPELIKPSPELVGILNFVK